MVPFHQKSRRPEFVQRRIRRPFSVSEVEALVQAVENLGTGRSVQWFRFLLWFVEFQSCSICNVSVLLICRWRDVKLCAFDGAKHRTYVDLKVKVYFLVPLSVMSYCFLCWREFS